MALLIPEYIQNKQYAAQRLRAELLDSFLQEGVVGGTDLKVVQRASGGANMSVDIAAGAAYVKGDTTTRQGLYHVYNDALMNIAIGANSSGNPRIDQIILRAYDSIDGGAGSDNAVLEVIAGTATAGATLDNRTGAAALPATAVRLADVLVINGAATITNSSIRDRRPWAGGVSFQTVRTTNNNWSTGGAVAHTIDFNFEFSGGLVVVTTSPIRFSNATGATQTPTIALRVDGTAKAQVLQSVANTASPHLPGFAVTMGDIAAGRHRIHLSYEGGGDGSGSSTLTASATAGFFFAVREIVGQNASND
jgi:hypothetical protein